MSTSIGSIPGVTSNSKSLDLRVLTSGLLLIGLGAAKGLEIQLVGRLFFTEVLLVALLPYLIAFVKPHPASEQFHKVILVLGLLWLWSQGLTDFIRQTPFEDWTRGNSKIAFLLLNYLALRRLLNDENRIRLFIVGIAIGTAISIGSEGWEDDTAWKFGLGSLFMTLGLVATGLRPLRYFPVAPIIVLLLLAGQSATVGSRSLAGIAVLTAGVLALGKFLDVVGAQSRWGRILGFCCVGLVALGGYRGFGYLSEEGVFGDKVQAKYREQVQGGGGNLLLGGRSETLISTKAISRSPIIGHGSWAKDSALRAEYEELISRKRNRTFLRSSSDLIPTHSYFFGAWVEAGVIGAAFWAFVFGLALWTIFKLMAWTQPLGPLAAFTACSLLWDIPFSPFGATVRINVALALILLPLAASQATRVFVRKDPKGGEVLVAQ